MATARTSRRDTPPVTRAAVSMTRAATKQREARLSSLTANELPESPTELKSLVSDLLQSRLEFASRIDYMRDGVSFSGKRDIYVTFGYKRRLTTRDYRSRYYRNGLAARIVEAYPLATWGEGPTIKETTEETPDAEDTSVAPEPTDFEAKISNLATRLDVWAEFTRADILMGLGEYSVILIGAPGLLNTPLPRLSSPDSILYLRSLPEDMAKIHTYNTDETDSRFGQPETYLVTLGVQGAAQAKTTTTIVHWTRILHLCEGSLLDKLHGNPRLRRTWNLLDDLDKIVGGGAEAAFKRADPGMQFDIDPSVKLTPQDEAKLNEVFERFVDGDSRTIQTKGSKINLLQSQVANFSANQDAIIHLIAAAEGLPHRILVGSERGELSSKQDRDNWSDRVSSRRTKFNVPSVRCFFDRMQEYGALPTVEAYDVSWPEVEDLSTQDKAAITVQFSQANAFQAQSGGKPVFTGDEIRQIVNGLGPIDMDDVYEDDDEDETVNQPPATIVVGSLPGAAGALPGTTADSGVAQGSDPQEPDGADPQSITPGKKKKQAAAQLALLVSRVRHALSRAA